ncbi:MAG: T9SS type A sorting domain-containing protein [Bacteroidia bacterium]
MKNRIFIITLMSLFSFSFVQAQTTQVLFLGNSYTGANNLPDLVYQLALSNGDSIQYDSNAPGGHTLQMHTQNVTSLAKINQQPWDYVFVQAQSQEPSLDTPYVQQNVFPFAHILDSLIQANDSCTQTGFFMTWGRKYGDASNCQNYPPVCTYLGMQQQLRGRYLQMGYDNNAVVVPVGAAWQEVIAQNALFDLFSSDGSHPSLHGSYLAACVFYATIYKRSPAGFSFTAGLPLQEAQLLQTVAGQLVLDSLATWNTLINFPQAAFNATITGNNQVTVTSTSTNANEFLWDDGVNGFVAGASTQVFNYNSNPPYTICLIASNGCFTDTICQLVNATSLPEQQNNGGLAVFPNPAVSNLQVKLPATNSGGVLHVTDMQGRIVQTYTIASNQVNVSLNKLDAGNYMLLFLSDAGKQVVSFTVLNPE